MATVGVKGLGGVVQWLRGGGLVTSVCLSFTLLAFHIHTRCAPVCKSVHSFYRSCLNVCATL